MYMMHRATADRNMQQLTVLLTSVGGLVSPGIIHNLRSLPEVSRIIGVDAAVDAIGFHMVDKHYIVPMGSDPEYVGAVSYIAERENIDVIIPCSDEEVLSLSRYKALFEGKGVAILCPDYVSVATAIDKGYMLEFLKQHGCPVPNFLLPNSTTELVQAVKELGYPTKPVVVKPRRGRGGRGVIVLREDVDVLSARDRREMKLKWFVDAVNGLDPLEIVLMEYLPGDDYSVDVLADKGSLLFIVPRKRIRAILGPSQLGEVVWNEEIVDAVRLIVETVGFSSNINIQLKYSIDYKPLVYEINPRISGTIVASAAAGIDLLREGIRYSLGLKPVVAPMTKPRSVKMIRYLKEYFVDKASISILW